MLLNAIFKLTTRDPLKRMLFDTPMEIITRGAEKGAQQVAEYVRGAALISSPWHSGLMANSHNVWRPQRPRRSDEANGVLASRRVAVDAQRADGYYYPVAIEFGWGDAPDGFPWLRRALQESAGEARSIYRSAMSSEVQRGAAR